MTNRPEHYGISNPGGVPAMQGNLAYDTYMETAQLRATAQKSLVFQQMQTALLGNMAGTLRNISSEMSQIRGLHEEALAVQQEMLKREVIQQHLEELIYQAEKLVAECSRPKSDMPPSSCFFLLLGLLKTVQDQGIGTAIIKGRDNKTAFERVVKEAKELVQQLRRDPEVQEALVWAKKIEDQRKRAEQEVMPFREKIASLQEQRGRPVSHWDVIVNWFGRIKSAIPIQAGSPAFVIALILGVCLSPFLIIFGIIILPFCLLGVALDRGRSMQERNKRIDDEIAALEGEIEKRLRKA